MPEITAINPSPRREGRYEIFVDGARFAAVSVDTIGRLKLRIRGEVDAQTLAEIERDAQALATLDRAMNMLDFRARSTRDLRRQLLKKGEPEAFVDEALEKLTRAGVLDDASYAKVFTRAKTSSQGFGKRRISMELSKRGISREVSAPAINQALEEEEINEKDILEKAAQKKLRTLERYDPETKKRRLYAYLARRGFSSEDISKALRRLLGREATEDAS